MTGHPEAHWRIIHSEVSTGWGGQIEVRHAGQLLPCRACFDKDSCVQPGAGPPRSEPTLLPPPDERAHAPADPTFLLCREPDISKLV
jgi:hypothetical protein